MAAGLAKHETPPHCAVQLYSMLKLWSVKGNQNQPVGGTGNEKRTCMLGGAHPKRTYSCAFIQATSSLSKSSGSSYWGVCPDFSKIRRVRSLKEFLIGSQEDGGATRKS